MSDLYELNLCGLSRSLRKVRVAPALSIASFVMLGDTEMIERCADALVERLPREGLDMLVCPEAKGIPLTHAVARRLGLNYVVARKSVKSYMENPQVEEVRSITTQGVQTVVLDGIDADLLKGKRVGVIDDVVSTGGSLKSLEALLRRVGCDVAFRAAVLLEEGGFDGELIYLERLPVFRD
jgi:adenine phosphoribosyltransferase